MDVVTDFLCGDLDKLIYMKFPEGLRDPKYSNLVYKLLKSLYGLKSASRQWYAKIYSLLAGLGLLK